MIYRTKEILKKRHRAILPFILSLVGKALLENMKKSAKGEEADATINPLDVVKGIKEGTGEDGDIKVSQKDADDLKQAMGDGVKVPEIVESDRTFEEQLAFTPPETQTRGSQSPQVPSQILNQLSQSSSQPSFQPPPIPSGASSQIVPAHNGLITGEAQTQTPRAQVPPGILAGLKESLLNLPSSAGDIPEGRTGRRTAFGVGETLGDFLRSNALRLSTVDPKSASPSRQVSQKKLDILNDLESGKRTIADLKDFEKIILRPPTEKTGFDLDAEITESIKKDLVGKSEEEGTKELQKNVEDEIITEEQAEEIWDALYKTGLK